MSTKIEVKYYNSFWVKKVENANTVPEPVWPGLPWNPISYPTFPGSTYIGPPAPANNWLIEESRIKGGFNNTSVSLGVRAYLNEEEVEQNPRQASLIYSGVFNSRTGVNDTNVFSIGEQITRSLDPHDGSIQQLYASDSNLIIFQERRVSKALIDKDVTYTNEGGTQTLPPGVVIGQIIPYAGKYGIGTYPESFTFWGNRKYFVDPNIGSVMRLSIDGLTEISEYGMKDFFRDELALIPKGYQKRSVGWVFVAEEFTVPVSTFTIDISSSFTTCNIFVGAILERTNGSVIEDTGAKIINIVDDPGVTNRVTITLDKAISITEAGGGLPQPSGFISYFYKSKIVGGWDNYNRAYTLSLQPTPNFIEDYSNYTTISYDESIRGWVSFFDYKPSFISSLNGKFYSMFGNSIYEHHSGSQYANYYGVQERASINFIFNANPSIKKNFQTINYEGSNGWEVESFNSGLNEFNLNYPTTSPKVYTTSYNDASASVLSYDGGYYTQNGIPYRAGFDRKENLYVANLINNSTAQAGEVIFSNQISGIKGFVGLVNIITDTTTDVGGRKELWSVGTKVARSS